LATRAILNIEKDRWFKKLTQKQVFKLANILLSMTFEFDVGFHGDIILYDDSKIINLGYEYNSELPVMLWLANLQISHSNLFEDFKLTKINVESKEIDELMKKVKTIADILPLTEEEFNKQMSSKYLSDFSNGDHSTLYEFIVNKSLLVLEATEKVDESNTSSKVLALDVANMKEMAEKIFKICSGQPWTGSV